jgi:hypothetical protein
MELGDMAFSPSEDIFYGVSWENTNFYRVTLSNGGSPVTVTVLGQLPIPAGGGIYSGLAVIPEPSTLVLLGIVGLALLGCGCVRKRYTQR